MGKTTKEQEVEEARAILSRLSDKLCDEFTAIAHDGDDATKMDRAAAIIAKAMPEVTGIVMMGLFGALREYEERFAVYESILAKVAAGAVNDFDA